MFMEDNRRLLGRVGCPPSPGKRSSELATPSTRGPCENLVSGVVSDREDDSVGTEIVGGFVFEDTLAFDRDVAMAADVVDRPPPRSVGPSCVPQTRSLAPRRASNLVTKSPAVGRFAGSAHTDSWMRPWIPRVYPTASGLSGGSNETPSNIWSATLVPLLFPSNGCLTRYISPVSHPSAYTSADFDVIGARPPEGPTTSGARITMSSVVGETAVGLELVLAVANP